MLFKDNPFDLGKLAFDLLAGSLRFVVPDKTQRNKSRWKTCRFWNRVLGAVEPLKLHVETPHNTLLETQRWLKEGRIIIGKGVPLPGNQSGIGRFGTGGRYVEAGQIQSCTRQEADRSFIQNTQGRTDTPCAV